MQDIVWFRRFRDIPNVVYHGSPKVDPQSRPAYGDPPQIEKYEFDGETRQSLDWPTDGGSTSASPAHRRAFGDLTGKSTADLLENLYEGLELPGEPSDYHFLIQGCAEELRLRRQQEPNVLEEVEKLCLLDLQLVEACPYAVQDEDNEEPVFYAILAFGTLIGLYEKEGALWEALAVAERAVQFDQEHEARQRLLERISELEKEDRPGD